MTEKSNNRIIGNDCGGLGNLLLHEPEHRLPKILDSKLRGKRRVGDRATWRVWRAEQNPLDRRAGAGDQAFREE